MRDLMSLPPKLPKPEDDGACAHLAGKILPSVSLRTTSDRLIDLKKETVSPTVIFFYPRTGEPHKPATKEWDRIPGARGCTPQSCGFRDLYAEFQALNFKVFGASSQSTAYQKEFVTRNKIPFEFISDKDFNLTRALKLPTFTYQGMRLIKRMALVIVDEKIRHVFYPVFPPDKNAETVLEFLRRGKVPSPG